MALRIDCILVFIVYCFFWFAFFFSITRWWIKSLIISGTLSFPVGLTEKVGVDTNIPAHLLTWRRPWMQFSSVAEFCVVSVRPLSPPYCCPKQEKRIVVVLPPGYRPTDVTAQWLASCDRRVAGTEATWLNAARRRRAGYCMCQFCLQDIGAARAAKR